MAEAAAVVPLVVAPGTAATSSTKRLNCAQSPRHSACSTWATTAVWPLGSTVTVAAQSFGTETTEGTLLAACRKIEPAVFVTALPSADGWNSFRISLPTGSPARETLAGALIPWWRTQAYYDSAAWRGTFALDGGGAVMNQGIHTIDLLLWFLGAPKRVSATAGLVAHDGIEVEDIAHGLAFVARWNGQTRGDWPYSVAEHSLLVETLFARANPGIAARWRLAALLHDAPEYVIGDMISPVKSAVGPGYAVLDERLTAAVHLRFGLPAQLPVAIKKAIKAAAGKARDEPGHEPLGQRATGMDDGEAIAERQPQRPPQEAEIHQQRLRLEPGHAFERQAMDGVGVVAIVFRRPGHIGGDDVDFLSAEAAIHLVEPDGGATFGRQEKLGENQVALGHEGFRKKQPNPSTERGVSPAAGFTFNAARAQ